MRVKVSEVMTRDVVSVSGGTPFKEIAEALVTHGISAVPVIDAEGRVTGVVSETDLLRKEQFRERYAGERYRPPLRSRLTRDGREAGRKALALTAAELMTAPAVTIHPQLAAVFAARMMAAHGVKRLPVVDVRGRLVGIVSRRDLLKVFLREDDELAREIREEALGHSVWADLSRIEVTVARGVVTLAGELDSSDLAGSVGHAVQRVDGVVRVIDRLDRGGRR
ncbi:MAG: CBS domain-containing protein [Nonomuraea sp.]|nr:CBS domain-containing protein [Nonomuraea sp.]